MYSAGTLCRNFTFWQFPYFARGFEDCRKSRFRLRFRRARSLDLEDFAYP